MKKLAIALLVSCFLIGCAIGTAKIETGKEIDERAIKNIVKGQTTSSEILTWFGAPESKTQLGQDEIFIYKFCKTLSTSTIMPFSGNTSAKQRYNELSIVFDTATGKVKDYSYKKLIED